MNIPSQQYLEEYFASMGSTLHQVESRDSRWKQWKLESKNGSTWEYASLLDLWMDWLRTAHRAINNEEVYLSFEADYLAAAPARREEIEQWFADYWEVPMGSKRMDPIIQNWGRPADSLPDDWQERLRTILDSDEAGRPFHHRATRFILRMTSEKRQSGAAPDWMP